MSVKLQKRPGSEKKVPDMALATNSFGGVVRKARIKKGFTQKELARRSGNVSAMFVSQIETGERLPSVRICQLLAKALELDEKHLLKIIHRSKAPEEIKQLLSESEAEILGVSLSPRLAALVKYIGTLSNEARNIWLK